jgi:hypothetical protein
MNTLEHVVDHANKHFEANRLGWRDVISSANDLLTCRDLVRFVALSMKVMMPWKMSITSTRIGNSRFLDALPTFRSGKGSRVTRKLKGATTWGATMKAGVAALNPLVDANNSLHITSGSRTLSGSSSVRKRQLGTANSRYVHILLIFIAVC